MKKLASIFFLKELGPETGVILRDFQIYLVKRARLFFFGVGNPKTREGRIYPPRGSCVICV